MFSGIIVGRVHIWSNVCRRRRYSLRYKSKNKTKIVVSNWYFRWKKCPEPQILEFATYVFHNEFLPIHVDSRINIHQVGSYSIHDSNMGR